MPRRHPTISMIIRWITKLFGPRRDARGADAPARLACLLLGILLLGCKPSKAPDLMVFAREIVTLDSNQSTADALAIWRGEIVQIGDSATIAARIGRETTVVSLPNAVVGPAFTDHHVHLANVGFALLNAATPGPTLAGFEATLTRKGSVGEHRSDPQGRRLAWLMNATLQPPRGASRMARLRPGAAADLVALSANPLRVPREMLAQIRALAAWSRGSLSRVDSTVAFAAR